MSNHTLSRRALLKHGALLAAPLMLGRAWAAAERPSPLNRLTVASIGVGGQGTQNMMGFSSYPEVQLVAVCDVDRARRNDAKAKVDAFYGNTDCIAYNDFRDVIARDDIDIIVNATPDHWHALPSIMAIEAGKDVYCEKPLSLTIAEGRAMVNAAKRFGAVTQAGTWQRSINKFRRGAEIVASGALGKVDLARVGLPPSPSQDAQPEMPVPEGFDYDMWLGQAPWAPYTASRCHGAFRFCYDYSGGELCDWGAHHLDVAQWYMGKSLTGPVAVDGQGTFPTQGVWNTATEYHIEYTYADGLKLITGTKEEWGPHFYGEDGKWLLVNRAAMDSNPKELLRNPVAPDDMRQLWVSGDHFGNFLDCVRTRQETVVPFEIAHRSITLCHLGNISMRLGRRLEWDPAAERFVNDPEADRMLSRAARSPWQVL